MCWTLDVALANDGLAFIPNAIADSSPPMECIGLSDFFGLGNGGVNGWKGRTNGIDANLSV